MNVTECTVKYNYIDWRISSITTIGEYEKDKKNPKLSLNIHNATSLECAVAVGNIDLIYHIALNEPGLLSRSSTCFGLSPLIRATMEPNHPLGLKIAKLLLALGANPNLTTTINPHQHLLPGQLLTGPSKTPEGATPLYIALEKSRNLTLILLLIEKKGVIQGKQPLSEEGKAVYKSLIACKSYHLIISNSSLKINADVILTIILKQIELINAIPPLCAKRKIPIHPIRRRLDLAQPVLM